MTAVYFGPKPGSGERPIPDPEKTPVTLHPRPAPVVMPSVRSRVPPPLPSRTATPLGLGSTLAPLGRTTPLPRVDPPAVGASSASNRLPGSTPYEGEVEPTPSKMHMLNRHMRNYQACSPANQRLLDAMALALREVPEPR